MGDWRLVNGPSGWGLVTSWKTDGRGQTSWHSLPRAHTYWRPLPSIPSPPSWFPSQISISFTWKLITNSHPTVPAQTSPLSRGARGHSGPEPPEPSWLQGMGQPTDHGSTTLPCWHPCVQGLSWSGLGLQLQSRMALCLPWIASPQAPRGFGISQEGGDTDSVPAEVSPVQGLASGCHIPPLPSAAWLLSCAASGKPPPSLASVSPSVKWAGSPCLCHWLLCGLKQSTHT